ncbi:MAG: TerD family protein [Pseudomonas sp.]|uniref:TerD family protein n=1 Tax=Pseudomonas sp. TaxID=306 RepID=UPI00339553A7
MTISLAKNQTISLEKQTSSLSSVSMGLGWDPVKAGGFFGKLLGGASEIDLDASCILFDAQKQVLDNIWFQQLQSRDGSIQHSGDNRTGEGEGDDETIQVDLNRLPANVQTLVFTVNSFQGQTFDKVANAYCRIVDLATRKELARFDLGEKGSHTGVVMAALQRTASGWNMTAIGTPTNGRTVQDLLNLAAQAVPA